MTGSGIVELDVHGLNSYQLKVAVDARLRRADRSVYRLRIIHGYHRGTALREELRRLYDGHPKVLRLEQGLNPGVTDLVLREF